VKIRDFYNSQMGSRKSLQMIKVTKKWSYQSVVMEAIEEETDHKISLGKALGTQLFRARS